MRKAEIMNFTWQDIILKTEFIILGGQRTNKNGRTIPSHAQIVESFRIFSCPVNSGYIFGQSKRLNRNEYNKAVEVAGITDLHFSGSLRLCNQQHSSCC